MLSEQLPEVVEVFTGDSLEEAMAFAVAALGPDLSVRRARKVRKGVQGLVGKDRYEVVAAPPPGAPSTDAVASAFDALLDQAEQAETPVRREDRPRSPHPAPSVGDHTPPAPQAPPAGQAPRRPARTTTRPPAPPAALPPAPPAPAPPAPATPAATATATARKAPVRKPTARAAAAPRTAPAPAVPGWSREALVALGLPDQVLRALPAEDPLDDLAWVVALAVAISTVLPAPAALGPDHPLVVDGYGTEGVVGLLDAAARGLTPGTITVGDRTAPATATELALAVRTAVVG